MKIVIIDDGVSCKSVNLPVYNYAVQNNKVIKDISDISPISHGSICAKIIEKYSEKVKGIISIKILTRDDIGNIDDLITALKWCCDNDIELINLSCGISGKTNISELEEICQALNRSNKLIISANNNNGELTYPACFPSVISVEQQTIQQNYKDWYRMSDIYTEGEHKLKQDEILFYSDKCNSYACAYACAIISNQSEAFYHNSLCMPRFSPIYDFSWLQNNILINETSINKRLFSFDYIEDFENLSVEQANLIIIPDKLRKKQIKQLICSNLNSIRKVVWCDKKIPLYIKKICVLNNIFYWDESVDCSKIYSPHIETPTIKFVGDADKVLNIITILSKLFENENYKAIKTSNMKKAYLFGYKKIYNKRSTDLYNYQYHPDIVFYYDTFKNSACNTDLIIRCLDGNIELFYEDAIETFSNYDLLFERIKLCFEQEN